MVTAQGSLIELEPTDVAHGGYCVARLDSRVVFVSGAIPGERILAEVVGSRSKMLYAKTIEVLDPSPQRIPHVWPLAEETDIGGVDLGHVRLDAGREWKAKVVEGQLARIAHINRSLIVEACPGDDARAGLAWRTRASFVADEQGHLCMHQAKGHALISVDSMPIAHEGIQVRMRSDMDRGAKREPGSIVTYVEPSASAPITVVTSASNHSTVPRVREQVRTAHGTWGYEVSADGFWQVHREAPSLLVETVLTSAGDTTGAIMDLYAGAGLFTVPLAHMGPVVSVEYDQVAVRALKANTSGLPVTSIAGDVSQVLARREPTRGGLVVADPPRSGLGKATVDQIVKLAPDKVILVACDPASLARDTALFSGRGYLLEDLAAFDLFPYTHHVECVACFRA